MLVDEIRVRVRLSVEHAKRAVRGPVRSQLQHPRRDDRGFAATVSEVFGEGWSTSVFENWVMFQHHARERKSRSLGSRSN